MILKIIPILIPFIIFVILRIAKGYIISSLFSRSKQKSNEMFQCEVCGTYVHEKLLISRFGKKYCSKKCSNF